MYARLARYQISPERCEEAVESFRNVVEGLSGLRGLARGYVLLDADEGKLLTLTVWTDRAAVEESRSRASGLRQQAVRAVDGSVESVAEYSVALEFPTTHDD
jgi:heme-degrading monooxygenase HmoA